MKTDQAYLAIGGHCMDCGPYCSPECAKLRNDHTTTVRPCTESELQWGGPADEIACRNCGLPLFDDPA